MSKSRAFHDAQSERIEILSVPQKAIDCNYFPAESFDNEPGEFERVKNQKDEKRLRFRDRFYNLFNSRKKKDDDDGELSTAPAEMSSSDIDGSHLSGHTEDSRSVSFSSFGSEDEEKIKELKRIIREQEEEQLRKLKEEEEEERELFTRTAGTLSESDCYDEETYLNTLRNQHIPPDLTNESESRKVSTSQESEIPVSKLFLRIYPEQAPLYKLEKESIETTDYQLLYSWRIWIKQPYNCPHTGERKLKLAPNQSIETKLDMSEIINLYSKRIQEGDDFEVHFFRPEFRPKKPATKGTVISFKAPYKKSYSVLKYITRMFLDDQFFQSEDLTQYTLKNTVIGVSFFMYETKFIVKLWCLKRVDPFRLCELIRHTLPERHQKVVGNASFYDGGVEKLRYVYDSFESK